MRDTAGAQGALPQLTQCGASIRFRGCRNRCQSTIDADNVGQNPAPGFFVFFVRSGDAGNRRVGRQDFCFFIPDHFRLGDPYYPIEL